MKRLSFILTWTFLMGILYSSNALAGINYIEYRQKYLERNHSDASAAQVKDSCNCCKCCR